MNAAGYAVIQRAWPHDWPKVIDATASPAGSNAGQFQLSGTSGMYQNRTASGSARQRRRQVRRWKRIGYIIHQFNPETRERFER